ARPGWAPRPRTSWTPCSVGCKKRRIESSCAASRRSTTGAFRQGGYWRCSSWRTSPSRFLASRRRPRSPPSPREPMEKETMNNVAIRAENVCKVYRLYTRPHYRVLDVLGLLRRSQGAFTEHAALRDINLAIRRGEKVAVIGRNGAGKSTLLKLVTRVTEPTAGRIEVAGKTHALLQIGTGFHPEFTGRENVFSYLAHLGVTGVEAGQRLREILGVAELEE